MNEMNKNDWIQAAQEQLAGLQHDVDFFSKQLDSIQAAIKFPNAHLVEFYQEDADGKPHQYYTKASVEDLLCEIQRILDQ